MPPLSANTDLRVAGSILRLLPLLIAVAPYQGSLIGIDGSTGYARPLVAGDKFAGVCRRRVERAPTASADISIDVHAGHMQARVTITSVAITDIGKTVYASDDGTFTLTPNNTPVGIVTGYVSSNTAEVELVTYDAEGVAADVPACMHGKVWEDVTGDKTLDIQDVGKVINVTADSVITLPAAAAGLEFVVRNGGVDAAVLVTISPQAADRIMGADLAGVDDKDRINTQATADRGDYLHIAYGGAAGYLVLAEVGTWAAEA